MRIFKCFILLIFNLNKIFAKKCSSIQVKFCYLMLIASSRRIFGLLDLLRFAVDPVPVPNMEKQEKYEEVTILTESSYISQFKIILIIASFAQIK